MIKFNEISIADDHGERARAAKACILHNHYLRPAGPQPGELAGSTFHLVNAWRPMVRRARGLAGWPKDGQRRRALAKVDVSGSGRATVREGRWRFA